MTDPNSNLPPPAQQPQTDWTMILSRAHPTSVDLMQYRTGTLRHPNAIVYHTMPTGVPHTSHPDYARIEDAKRNKRAALERQERKRAMTLSTPGHNPMLPLRPPIPYVGVMTPNFKNYRKALSLSIPKRFY